MRRRAFSPRVLLLLAAPCCHAFAPTLLSRAPLLLQSQISRCAGRHVVPFAGKKGGEEIPSEEILSSTDAAQRRFEIGISNVVEAWPGYLTLAALQFLPLASVSRAAGLTYFGTMALLTVYLGSKRQDLPAMRSAISGRQAALAPIFSSVSLFGLYALLKYTKIDPSTFYQYLTTLFAVTSVASVGSSVLGALLPPALAEAAVPVPAWIGGKDDGSDKGEVAAMIPAAAALATAAGVALAATYLSPGLDIHQKFLVGNALAWCIAMQSIGLLQIQSFMTACVFLGGLFLYDIYWVFGTDVMVTVATTLTAPVKFEFPNAETARMSVLGLGDIVIPGIYCAMMRNFDKSLAAEDDADLGGNGRRGKVSYFAASVGAYAAGLAACFAVNQISHSGQPALLYLNPAIIVSALLTAAVNGGDEMQRLFQFRQEGNLPPAAGAED